MNEPRMSNQNVQARVALASLAVALFVVTGCGGGGGGGGGAPTFLSLTAPMNYWIGSTPVFPPQAPVNPTPYPTTPINGVPVPAGATGPTAYNVAPPVFTAGNAGQQTFIELQFNTSVKASSITTTPSSGLDGIVVYFLGGSNPPPVGSCLFAPGTPVCVSLDSAGVLNAANLVTSDVAPSTLRLYYNPDGNIATADPFPAGNYALVITNYLQSSTGGPFCATGTGAGCINSLLPVMPFTVAAVGGGDTTLLAMSASSPVVPVNGSSAVKINSEIVLNFTDAVDFLALVGQTSTRDPFISPPFRPFAAGANAIYEGGAGDDTVATNGALTIQYNLPTDPTTNQPQGLPTTLGYVVYMPDPISNPAQVRIRWVDITGLQPTQAGVTFQNYASNPSKFPITSSDPAQPAGTLLLLPPIKPVPGTLVPTPTVTTPNPAPVLASVSVTVNANAAAPTAQDRSGNVMAANFTSGFAWEAGPRLARNPVPPDAIFVGVTQGGTPPFDRPGLGVVSTANITVGPGGAGTTYQQAPCQRAPVTYGAQVTGAMTYMQTPLANASILGIPKDMEVGTFLNPANSITDPPRDPTQDPGVVASGNGSATASLLLCLGVTMAPAPPPYGNRLYVIDGTSNSVKVINSFDFSLITTLSGISSPNGLGISPDLNFLYVSNGDQGTVQRVYTNPASPAFHTVANTITVGNSPKSVTVQPGNEDVFVANFAENTLSVIRVAAQTERIRVPVGYGPSEIAAGMRMLGMGLTNEYMAYVFNYYGNTVTVYESAGGAVLENLPNGKIIKTVSGLLGPKAGCWNWQTYIGGSTQPGVMVANTLGSTVDQITMYNFTLSPQPGFPGPPGRRDFNTLSQFSAPTVVGSAQPTDAVIENMSGLYNVNLAGVTNNKSVVDAGATGSGAVPSVVAVAYPGAGRVVAFSYGSPTILGSVVVPGLDFIHTYYDQ